jgi:hypothetical protein
MKITVQNGAAHGLSRRDLEAVIPLFPASWMRCVKQVVLYQGAGEALRASYYPKDQILGLFWPAPGSQATKQQAVTELLLALSVIAERGELPAQLATSLRERHLRALDGLCALTYEAMAQNAG